MISDIYRYIKKMSNCSDQYDAIFKVWDAMFVKMVKEQDNTNDKLNNIIIVMVIMFITIIILISHLKKS